MQTPKIWQWFLTLALNDKTERMQSWKVGISHVWCSHPFYILVAALRVLHMATP